MDSISSKKILDIVEFYEIPIIVALWSNFDTLLRWLILFFPLFEIIFDFFDYLFQSIF